jgi:hypothetical protein
MPKRPVYLLQNGPAPDTPTVRISRTQEGITFSITATGRSLNLARIRAEKTYQALAAFVEDMEFREEEMQRHRLARQMNQKKGETG